MIQSQKRTIEFTQWCNPILEALRDLGGSAKPKEIARWIAMNKNISDEVLNARYPTSGSLKFSNQLAWCRQYMIWEGILSSPKRGIWSLTPQGWNAKLSVLEANDIVLKWSKYFQELKVKEPLVEGNADKKNAPKEMEAEINEEIKQEHITPTLLEILKGLSPTGFEHLCGRLLREYDFEDIEITQRSHDGGIDGFANLKINPLVNMSVFFQCKRYDGTVPTEKVQAFVGVLETDKRRVEKGLMITTGSFAKGALEIEKSNIKLELIDGETLVEMFEKKELGLIPITIYEPDISFFEQYRDME